MNNKLRNGTKEIIDEGGKNFQRAIPQVIISKSKSMEILY